MTGDEDATRLVARKPQRASEQYGMNEGEEKKTDESFSAPLPNPEPLRDNGKDERTAAIAATKKERRDDSPKKNDRSTCGSLVSILALILTLDLPLILTFTLYLASLGLERLGEEYFVPQVDLQRFTPDKAEVDLTYYHRVCDESDQTATDTSEFVVGADTTTDEAVNLMLVHGVTAIPDLLSPETAHELREFILQENAVSKELIYVIENENRWSFPITVDQHPSIPKALKEVFNKQRLVDILEAVVGPNPAVIEFTAITSAYGAVGQHWHQDVVPEGNGAKYSRNFVPSYSLFIPLQNTTASMGATGICPGTHMCAAGCDELCGKNGFQVSGRDDNWPLGTGAFVNQQTTHRGEAHLDPNAPARVVFILTFAPRPQTLPKTVETRMIGTSGSYSLHYSQWGHTLRDFQHPDTTMRQPWRTLRSLGVYKSRASQWGWDYLTVCSCRIANSDTGFNKYDLDEFLEMGGFWWLPKRLHGDSSDDDDETSMVWVYFLQDTVKKCKEAFVLVHRGALSLYLVLMLVFTFLCGTRRSRRKAILTTTVRLATFHLGVLLVAWWANERIANSTWGHNIRNQRSFSLPETMTLAPSLPATLPTKEDVFVFEGMQSEYFGSFTRVLEVWHPGNKAWHNIVSRFSTGYSAMSPELQHQIQLSMWLEARQQRRRILVKNDEGNWAEASPEYSIWFCHKSLMQRSNRFVGAASQYLDFLLSETRFGYWRDTALHQRFISLMLVSLQDKILGVQRDQRKKSLADIPVARNLAQRWLRPIRSYLPTLPQTAKEPLVSLLRNATPVVLPGEEPFLGAWLKEGDTVEAAYDDSSEWYRGITIYASANRLLWDVEYDDGDVLTDLPPASVRPYVPYQLHESIEVRVDEVSFAAGRVIAVNSIDDTFDIELEDDGGVFTSVPPMDIRRRVGEAPPELAVGDRVQAQFPGAEDGYYYPGTVTKVHPRGSVDVQYDDGDFMENLPRSVVELME